MPKTWSRHPRVWTETEREILRTCSNKVACRRIGITPSHLNAVRAKLGIAQPVNPLKPGKYAVKRIVDGDGFPLCVVCGGKVPTTGKGSRSRRTCSPACAEEYRKWKIQQIKFHRVREPVQREKELVACVVCGKKSELKTCCEEHKRKWATMRHAIHRRKLIAQQTAAQLREIEKKLKEIT